MCSVGVSEGHERARDKGVPAQYLIEVDRDEALLAAELTWLDAAIARVDDPDFPWGSPAEPSERYLAQRKAARQ